MMKNIDKLKNAINKMSMEEIADILTPLDYGCNFCVGNIPGTDDCYHDEGCNLGIKAWLDQEADNSKLNLVLADGI